MNRVSIRGGVFSGIPTDTDTQIKVVILNAANEVAVESFLNDQISFDKIYEVIHRTFDNNSMSKDVSIESIYEADTQTRIKAKKVVKSIT